MRVFLHRADIPLSRSQKSVERKKRRARPTNRKSQRTKTIRPPMHATKLNMERVARVEAGLDSALGRPFLIRRMLSTTAAIRAARDAACCC